MQDYVDTLASKREELGRVCRVFFILDLTRFLQCLKQCVTQREDVIGIITGSMERRHVEGIKSMSIYHNFPINLVVIDPKEVVIPLLQHVLHDKHWFVGRAEALQTVELGDRRVSVWELPTLLTSDPVCVWYGFRAGDVVCCNTIQSFSPSNEYFQLVRHDTLHMTGSLRGL